MKTVRLPSDNPDGLIALGPFLAGKCYAVPDDVAPMLDARLALAEPGKGETLTPTTAAHEEVFAHVRALAALGAQPKQTAEAEPAKPAKAATQVSN